jgi:hypothetical protein
VPEGSVVIVTLLAIAFGGIVDVVDPSVFASLYVDGFAFCDSRRTVTAERRLQITLIGYPFPFNAYRMTTGGPEINSAYLGLHFSVG